MKEQVELCDIGFFLIIFCIVNAGLVGGVIYWAVKLIKEIKRGKQKMKQYRKELCDDKLSDRITVFNLSSCFNRLSFWFCGSLRYWP